MAKYSLTYMLGGKRKTEFFSKLPKGTYRASGYQNPRDKGKPFLTRLTDSGTALIPLKRVYRPTSGKGNIRRKK